MVENISDNTFMTYYGMLDGVDISLTKFKEIIKSTYSLIDQMLDGQILDTSNLPLVVAKLMIVFEGVVGLSGNDRKKVLIMLLKIYLDNLNKDLENTNLYGNINLGLVLNTLVSGMIDTMILIDKKDITINKVAKTCCFSMMNTMVKRNVK